MFSVFFSGPCGQFRFIALLGFFAGDTLKNFQTRCCFLLPNNFRSFIISFCAALRRHHQVNVRLSRGKEIFGVNERYRKFRVRRKASPNFLLLRRSLAYRRVDGVETPTEVKTEQSLRNLHFCLHEFFADLFLRIFFELFSVIHSFKRNFLRVSVSHTANDFCFFVIISFLSV